MLLVKANIGKHFNLNNYFFKGHFAMIVDNSNGKNSPKHSRISKIHRFLKSKVGFKIGIIIIGFLVIVLIEFGLILIFLLGEVLGNDFLMSYSIEKMIFLNINEVTINESTNLWFRFGFLSLLFGVVIGIFSMKSSPQPTIQSKKLLQKYISLTLIIIGILLLILSC